jgi:hypothetical protein
MLGDEPCSRSSALYVQAMAVQMEWQSISDATKPPYMTFGKPALYSGRGSNLQITADPSSDQ